MWCLRPGDLRLDTAAAQLAPAFARVVGAVAVSRFGRRRGRPRRPRTGGIASTSGIIWVMSLRLPPVSPTVSGVPRPQTIRWCLEPLRERSTGLGPVLRPPKRPHVRAVDRRSRPVDPLRLIELREQQLVQPLPDAGLLPLAQPPPTGHPEPQPISCGRYSQGIPVCNTNKIPVNTFRSSIRFRPGNRCRPAPPGSTARPAPTTRPTPTASPSSPSFRTRLTTPTSSANSGSLLSIGALSGVRSVDQARCRRLFEPVTSLSL